MTHKEYFGSSDVWYFTNSKLGRKGARRRERGRGGGVNTGPTGNHFSPKHQRIGIHCFYGDRRKHRLASTGGWLTSRLTISHQLRPIRHRSLNHTPAPPTLQPKHTSLPQLVKKKFNHVMWGFAYWYRGQCTWDIYYQDWGHSCVHISPKHIEAERFTEIRPIEEINMNLDLGNLHWRMKLSRSNLSSHSCSWHIPCPRLCVSGMCSFRLRRCFSGREVKTFLCIGDREWAQNKHLSIGLPGALYPDGTSSEMKKDDSVPPGGSYTYRWEVRPEFAPTDGDANCLTWVYHSHLDAPREIASGLIGALLTCKKGMKICDDTCCFIILISHRKRSFSWRGCILSDWFI